jgi:hypothetical protein
MAEKDKPQYVKVVETSDVTAETLTEIINEMLAEDWRLDTIHFAMRDNSRRPAMAFLLFYRPEAAKRLHVAPKS